MRTTWLLPAANQELEVLAARRALILVNWHLRLGFDDVSKTVGIIPPWDLWFPQIIPRLDAMVAEASGSHGFVRSTFLLGDSSRDQVPANWLKHTQAGNIKVAGVTFDRVSKVYQGNYVAVNDISLEIHDQEFLVLVGPSGCGKTTTLRMVAGLEEITSGEIRIGERVVNHVAPKDRDIAMVFQNYALYPHMTVYQNLAFALKLRKVAKAEIDRRVQWAAQLLGLNGLLDRRPKALSGGQRQRVAVGRAIVRQPQVFLFDEPLSNLDAKLRVTTRAELKRLQHDLKTTTIYVTHDQEEAMTLGDRVVVMHQGKIQQCGTPLEVYRDPVNRFVAEFVGMPPMNLIEGEIRPNGDRMTIESGDWSGQIPRSRFRDPSQLPAGSVGLGIRPEVMEIASSENPSADLQFNVIVDVVEILGATMDVTVRFAGGRRLICRVPTREISVGDKLRLVASTSRVHVFGGAPSDDPTGRRALTLPSQTV